MTQTTKLGSRLVELPGLAILIADLFLSRFSVVDNQWWDNYHRGKTGKDNCAVLYYIISRVFAGLSQVIKANIAK